MSDHQVVEWTYVQNEFFDKSGRAGTLILGNGASIAIDKCFGYKSLLETAQKTNAFDSGIDKVFELFRTQDFELVLREIWHASKVNEALGTPVPATQAAYSKLRTALIAAVRDVHAEYEKAEKHLLRVCGFMQDFRTVVSLNYDLIIYWSMLKGNEELKQTWFKDGFIKESFAKTGLEFPDEWEFLRSPHEGSGAKGATLVFYPHGCLMLGEELGGNEIKIVRDEHESSKLLQTVLDRWLSGLHVPLFVSEGSSAQKREAIQRSRYLRTVHDKVLPKLNDDPVIYGWSLKENDRHLVKQICLRKRKIAVSVHKGDKSEQEIQDECERITREIRLVNKGVNIVFYDANSAGCWIH